MVRICDKWCCSDPSSKLFLLPSPYLGGKKNRRFQQHSPATVQGDCVGGNMKGRNLNVSDTASTEPRWIPLRTLGRLAAGMRTYFRCAWSITDKYYRNKPSGCEKHINIMPAGLKKKNNTMFSFLLSFTEWWNFPQLCLTTYPDMR